MESATVFDKTASVSKPEGAVATLIRLFTRVGTYVFLQIFTICEGLVAGLASKLWVGCTTAVLKVALVARMCVQKATTEGAGQHRHPTTYHTHAAAVPNTPAQQQPAPARLKQEDNHHS